MTEPDTIGFFLDLVRVEAYINKTSIRDTQAYQLLSGQIWTANTNSSKPIAI